LTNGQAEILPSQISVSSGINLQRVLSTPMEKPNLFVFKKYRTPLRIHDSFCLVGNQIKQDIKIHLGCDDLADMKKFDMAIDLLPELPIFTSPNSFSTFGWDEIGIRHDAIPHLRLP
jgi:hypothetical protein